MSEYDKIIKHLKWNINIKSDEWWPRNSWSDGPGKYLAPRAYAHNNSLTLAFWITDYRQVAWPDTETGKFPGLGHGIHNLKPLKIKGVLYSGQNDEHDDWWQFGHHEDS